MSSRDTILSGIKTSLRKSGQRSADGSIAQKAVLDRMSAKKRNIAPSRTTLPNAELVQQFKDRLVAVQGSFATLPTIDAVPEAVASYLREHNLPSTLKMAPDPTLRDLDWHKAPMLETSEGRADGSETASITTAVKGVSETATLILHSEAKRPTTLNFLPEYHIVVLKRSDIVGSYEDSFEILRDANPRTINMITGPSRTGDIEQTLYLGAHGPRKLHVLIIED